MSRPVCSECLCVIDETGCGCVQPIEPFTNHEQGEMNANELAEDLEGAKLVILRLNEMLRQQQAEIEKLRSWVEMLVEVPFFNEIDHYRGIPVAILRKASEK